MDAEVKQEVLRTLRTAEQAADRARALFIDLGTFLRADYDGRVSILTITNIFAEALERGIEKGLKAQARIKAESHTGLRDSTPPG